VQISVEQIDLHPGHSFAAFSYEARRLDHAYHLHDEVELAIVHDLGGVVQCGATTTSFASGDLFLFGPGVAHRFVGSTDEDAPAVAQVIQFRLEVFGERFFALPENARLAALLERAQLGLVLRSPGQPIRELIAAAIDSPYSRRLVALLSLLSTLAENSRWQAISGVPLLLDTGSRDTHRIRTLQTLLHERSREQLRESLIAEELGLTRTSFCRWIRSVTGRTFSAFVNDHRITQAVLMLQQTDEPVTTIALEVGYQSLSHFYREFTRRHGTVPTRMRRG